MRLFVALPLATPARDALGALIAGWQRLDWPVRWVARESLHLTLRFLGEMPGESLEGIRSALDESAARMGPIELVPRAVEFHPARRARVLWLALEPVPALELLAHRLEQGLAGQPGMRELDGPFRPHITLGRAVRDARVPRAAFGVVAEAVIPDAWLASRVVLYQSELGGGPPRYIERHAVELRA